MFEGEENFRYYVWKQKERRQTDKQREGTNTYVQYSNEQYGKMTNDD